MRVYSVVDLPDRATAEELLKMLDGVLTETGLKWESCTAHGRDETRTRGGALVRRPGLMLSGHC